MPTEVINELELVGDLAEAIGGTTEPARNTCKAKQRPKLNTDDLDLAYY